MSCIVYHLQLVVTDWPHVRCFFFFLVLPAILSYHWLTSNACIDCHLQRLVIGWRHVRVLFATYSIWSLADVTCVFCLPPTVSGHWLTSRACFVCHLLCLVIGWRHVLVLFATCSVWSLADVTCLFCLPPVASGHWLDDLTPEERKELFKGVGYVENINSKSAPDVSCPKLWRHCLWCFTTCSPAPAL